MGSDDDILQRVGRYASGVVGTPPEAISAIVRFPDGNRHAVYRVSYRDGSGVDGHVVVRVANAGGAAECAQGSREAAVLTKVGGAAAPLLYDFDCASPWFDTPVMSLEFSPGERDEAGLRSDEDIAQLGSIVAWVHEQPVDDLATALGATVSLEVYARTRLDAIRSSLAWVRDPLPIPLRQRLLNASQTLATTFEAFDDSDRTVLMHGDLGPGNVLWAPQAVLIDWEYTRLGDRADEIAYFFDQNRLREHQRRAFWHGYSRSTSEAVSVTAVMKRVEWWEPVTLLGSALWWVERWIRRVELDTSGASDPALARAAGYYLDHVTHRLDRLEAFLSRE